MNDPILSARAASLFAVLFCAAPLRAQSFNIDLGENQVFPAPPVSYAAAAQQPGYWNAVDSVQFPAGTALRDLAGNTTSIAFAWTSGFPGGHDNDNSATSGWDQLLMDDAEASFQAIPLGYRFSGLAAGPYDVYTYAWNPLTGPSGGVYYAVSVAGSPDPVQLVGGPWLGQHSQGHSFAKHFVFLTSGQTLDVTIQGQFISEPNVNGFQIVKRDEGFSYCFGDASGTPCPCGNDNPPGTIAGCLNSFGGAGTLGASGVASVTSDSLVLLGSSMPNTTVSYFQGTTHALGSNGMGVPLADGLGCVAGTLIRLGTKFNVGGASQYPDAGEQPVSIKGMIPPGGGFIRMYQTQYRDPDATFCTSMTFNRTNAWQVIWAP